MKKYYKYYIVLLISMFFLFIHVDAAEMITYMGCGNQKGIAYDLPGFVRNIITIIQIMVPIILILIGSVDLFKVVFGNDKDDLGKAIAKLVKRSIFAAAVFFSVVLVKLLLALLGKDNDSFLACVSCFTSDESKCYTYEVEKKDNSEEKSNSQKDREDLEAKREEARKENEKEADDAKKDHQSSSGNNSSGNSSSSTGISGTKTIYVGDSRTVQMCAYLTGDWTNCQYNNGGVYTYNSNEYFIAQGSMGYDWFNKTAAPAVTKILKSDPNTTYNIVSYMGVNGLGADKYDSKYKELAKGDWNGHNIVLVSINPVDEFKESQNGYSTKNSSIESFNSKIKSTASSLSNASYCDIYNAIKNNFGTTDGLHYDSATSKDIYNRTKTCITNSSKSTSTNTNCSKSGTYSGMKFCAPNPNSTLKFGSANDTPGCPNEVQHDISYPEGTPVYSAIDGTAYFYQTHCNGVLYSYGNKVEVVGSDGTKVIYAHFSKFANGINVKYTSTCNAPCSSSTCSTGVQKYKLHEKKVKAGELLGYSGNTGNSLGPHLHVEIKYRGNGCVVDLNKAFGL